FKSRCELRVRGFNAIGAATLGFALLASGSARAQSAPLPDSVAIGGGPSPPPPPGGLPRGGVWRPPRPAAGGGVGGAAGGAAGGEGTAVPSVIDTTSAVEDQVLLAERSRVGLSVDRGPVTAVFTLQDARELGSTEAAYVGAGEAALPALEPLDAYIDLHTR